MTGPRSLSDAFQIGVHTDGSEIFQRAMDDHVAVVMQARMDRLDAEARALLAAGHDVDDIVVVTSPLWPDSKVVTKAEMGEHADELWAAAGGYGTAPTVRWAQEREGHPA